MEEKRKAGVFHNGKFFPAGTGYVPNRRFGRRKLLPILLVTILFALPLFTGINLLANLDNLKLEYRDTYTHSTQMTVGDQILTLNIANIQGKIEINNNLQDKNNLFEITTNIRSNDEGVDEYSDNRWEIERIGNTYSLSFSEENRLETSKIVLEYNHQIRLNKNITLFLDLHTDLGSMKVELSDLIISNSKLVTVSGSIVYNVLNSEMKGAITLSTESGHVDFNAEGIIVNLSEISINTVSGNIILRIANSKILSDLKVDASVVSGDINLYWRQQDLTYIITTSMEAVSGKIQCELYLNKTITTKYRYDTVSGEINVPENNQGSAGNMVFDISNVSGDIVLDYFQL